MSTQELSTVSYNADISKANFTVGWEAAKAALKRWTVVANIPNKLNEDALAKIMIKSKKELKFYADLSTDYKTITVYAKSGGDKVDNLVKSPLNAGKNKLWVADMTALKEKSQLVDASTLATFIKDHPDQEAIDALKKDFKTLQDDLKTKEKAVADQKTAIVNKGKEILAAGGKL